MREYERLQDFENMNEDEILHALEKLDGGIIVRAFENINGQKQIKIIARMLEKAGFIKSEPIITHSKYGRENVYFTKESCDIVLCVIKRFSNRPEGMDEFDYILIDKQFYEKMKKNGQNINAIRKRREGEGYTTITKGGGDKLLYHHVCEVQGKGFEVDHVTHNYRINLREYLRPCSSWQNAQNKKNNQEIRIDLEAKTFRTGWVGKQKEKVDDYLKKGFRKNEFEIISPSYENIAELRERAIEFIDDFSLFFYNPQVDFYDTWYVLVLWRMLGVITEKECYEYQIEHFWQKTEQREKNRKGNLNQVIVIYGR